MKKVFLIHSNSNWSPNVGGSIQLHKLCNDLNQIGEKAFITNKRTNPVFNAPTYSYLNNDELIQKINNDNLIVVYTGSEYDNPLKAKNIVRLIQHTKKAQEIYKNTYNPTGLIFRTSDFYKDEHINKKIPFVYSVYFDYLIFRNLNMKRTGTAYMIRKGVVIEREHPEGSLLIDPYANDWVSMMYIFNKIEKFYCYDNETTWCALAALCGCIVVVIPCRKANMTATEWRSTSPIKKYGIAYGNTIEEITYAINTITLVESNLRLIEKNSINTVRQFAEQCHNFFK